MITVFQLLSGRVQCHWYMKLILAGPRSPTQSRKLLENLWLLRLNVSIDQVWGGDIYFESGSSLTSVDLPEQRAE